MDTAQTARSVDAVVRCLSTAAKSLKLYPPTSPMPRQSTEAVLSALEAHFATGEPLFNVAVTRDGLTAHGTPVAAGLMGTSDLASALREHGVAELSILPGCSLNELIDFLMAVGETPESVRMQGGLSVAMVMAGVDCVRVSDVQLTVIEQVGPAPDEDIDEFLRRLIGDPEKLAAWFSAAAAGDPHAFEEGLMELSRVAGPLGAESLLTSLAGAFKLQDGGAKDALLGLAMGQGNIRDLSAGVFRHLESPDIAGAVLGGQFGKNMLSLSTALTKLPLEQVTAKVRAEIQAMLPGTGHSGKEARFLDHMIEVRERKDAEPALTTADPRFRTMMEASSLPKEILEQARGAVSRSGAAVSAATVRTMRTLLEQQRDFELFCQGAESLAGMVPRLVEQGDLDTAASIVADLSNRAAFPASTWPDLPRRLQAAIEVALGPRSMAALVAAVLADRSRVTTARQMMRAAGESCAVALVVEASAAKGDGLVVAEEIVGRRIIDILNQTAPKAQWFELRAITARLVREGDARSLATVERLLQREDEQSRREVVAGLSDSGSAQAARPLAAALRDSSREVALVAVRALARLGQGAAGQVLAARIAEIDIDNGDFVLGREIITALAGMSDPASGDALTRLASRRALIKKGHFAEVQELAARAVAARAKGVAAR